MLADPTKYFFLVLEIQAARMTTGGPPPRMIFRPTGQRVQPPSINCAERTMLFSDARIQGQAIVHFR